MSAYLMIIAEITNPEGFAQYAKAAAALTAKYGGHYEVLMPAENHLLEGEWDDAQRVVISKWESVEAALKFWNSDDYAQAKKLREGNSKVRVRLVSGTS